MKFASLFQAVIPPVLLFLSAFPVLAQEKQPKPSEKQPKQEEPKQTVFTPGRVEQPLNETGSVVTVITAEEIEKQKPKLLLDVIRNVPGLEVTRTAGLGSNTSIFLRGANSSHTLVLVDGVEVNTPTTAAFDFANMTADNVERVEILRGPQSTLYGASAVGGVIAITTKQGKGKPSVRVGGEYGSFDTYRGWIGASGTEGEADFSMTASYLKSRGISSASEDRGNREEDGYDNFTGSARVGYRFLDDGRIDLTLRGFDSESEIDGFGVSLPADDRDRRLESKGILGSVQVRKPLFDWWTPIVRVTGSENKVIGTDPTDSWANSRTKNRVFTFEHQSVLTLMREKDMVDDTLVTGFELEGQEGESQGNFRKDVENRAVFAENQIRLWNTVNWTIGFRHDDHSEFGGHTTGRTTATVRVSPVDFWTLRPHGSYGTGFRAPSLNDLFFPGFSNPDLEEERSQGWDAGMEHSVWENKIVVDVLYFANEFKDLIVLDSSFIPQNIGRAESRGTETIVSVKPCAWAKLFGSYTLMDAENKDNNQPLPRRPHRRTTAGFDIQPMQSLRVYAAVISVYDRVDWDLSPMSSYELVNVTTQVTLSEKGSVYVRVENLFDREYEEVRGYGSPGFGIYAGTDWKF